MRKNLLKITSLLSCAIITHSAVNAQITFTNKNTVLHSSAGVAGSNASVRSGNSVSVVDINGDGLDDICKLSDNGDIRIEYQQAGGTFTFQNLGNSGASGCWAMCMGDVDKNGYKDVLLGQGNSLVLMKVGAAGSMGLTTLAFSNFFQQNLNFMDIDGDTWLDVFACDDNAYAKIYVNDGAGNLDLLGHSTTSLTIATGSKSLTVQTGLNISASQLIRVGYSGQNYMQGTVTSYNSGTGALVVNIMSVIGSGTYATWSVHENVVLNTQLSTLTVGGDPYDSGNYGTVWTDFDNDGDVDLYVAKCRQAASSGTDYRRKDVLFRNDGNGLYTESAATYNTANYDQDWTPSFGDIDNDGDFDLLLTKHNTSSAVYTNDGSGHFTLLTTVTFGTMPMQSQFEDLDNDGFVDIIMSGDDDHRIYRNNQNGTFTNQTQASLMMGGSTNILSFASGDLNHDGMIDLYASYGGTYNNPSNTYDDIFWQNATINGNHYLTLNLTSTLSNIGSVGARAYIYGAWGVQTREVRAGESYGTLNSSQLHFGLGVETVVDSVVVNWPSGVQTVIVTPTADQFLNVIEQNSCTLSGATVSANGPLTFCTSGSVDLTANASGSGSGYTYLWSNGATTQTISVTTGGNYAVTVTESSVCHATSSNVSIIVNPVETPIISAIADTVFCAGDSVMLSSTSSGSYLWSNGATTQSTYVSQSGAYSVQTQGLCQTWNSNSISVNVHPAPAPGATDVTLPAPATTTLTATGNAVVWYANPTGGAALATGGTYNTPMISSDTVFYAEDSYNYGGGTVFGAPKYYFGGGTGYSAATTNGYLIFTANTNCTLKKVKVYTDTPGTRKIELRSSTGTVLQTQTVNIPVDSSFVVLNFTLTAGTAYQLGTNTAQNNTTLGTTSPRLKRANSSSVVYPYNITLGADNLVAITGTNPTGTVFYYFFDWEVETAPVVCTSARTPVHVFINPVGIKEMNNSGAISIYPNPASDFVNIVLKEVKDAQATISIHDLLGKQVYNETYTATAHSNKTISTSGFSKGTYAITISVDGKVYHSRIVVQ